jgi:glycosyltransferase involved in cell wall biosynthesis
VIALVVARTLGGTGRHVHALVRALVAGGRDVVVAGPREAEEAFGFGAAGAEFVPVEVATGPRPPSDLRAVRRLRPVLRDAEVVHAHGIRAAALAGAALPRAVRPRAGPPGAGPPGAGPPGAASAGAAWPGAVPTGPATDSTQEVVPFVVTWHNRILGSPLRRRLWVPLERRVARRADVTLCVSADLAERVRALGGRDVRVASVGARRPAAGSTLDAGRLAALRAQLGAADRPLVVAAGRLTEQKGHDLLLDAAAMWEVRTPRPRTVIAGDGPLRPALSRAIDERGLDVELLGRRGDVPELFAAADVVALPSRWEGSPLTAHEALFSGTPLVATAVGGVPDLAGGGGAVALTAPGDARAFAEAVLRLLDDPAAAARQAAAGLRRAHEWPDEEQSARRVLAVYDELRTP